MESLTTLDTDAASSRETERRRARRQSGIWAGALEIGDDRITCIVLDVSATGARVRSERFLPPGEIVMLSAPKLASRRSRIVWTAESLAGVEFLGQSVERKFLPF